MSDQFVTLTIEGKEYTDIVPHDYKMDPETETLLYADELENGMMVLVEDGRSVDTTRAYNNSNQMLNRSRWATVHRLRAEESGMYFIAVYSDGDMCIRQSKATSGWFVKKDSIKPRNAGTVEVERVTGSCGNED